MNKRLEFNLQGGDVNDLVMLLKLLDENRKGKISKQVGFQKKGAQQCVNYRRTKRAKR